MESPLALPISHCYVNRCCWLLPTSGVEIQLCRAWLWDAQSKNVFVHLHAHFLPLAHIKAVWQRPWNHFLTNTEALKVIVELCQEGRLFCQKHKCCTTLLIQSFQNWLSPPPEYPHQISAKSVKPSRSGEVLLLSTPTQTSLECVLRPFISLPQNSCLWLEFG
jgi:hypothetical protein